MGVISFLVSSYLAWSGNRVRRLLGDGPTTYQFSEIGDEEETALATDDGFDGESAALKMEIERAEMKSFELA